MPLAFFVLKINNCYPIVIATIGPQSYLIPNAGHFQNHCDILRQTCTLKLLVIAISFWIQSSKFSDKCSVLNVIKSVQRVQLLTGCTGWIYSAPSMSSLNHTILWPQNWSTYFLLRLVSWSSILTVCSLQWILIPLLCCTMRDGHVIMYKGRVVSVNIVYKNNMAINVLHYT